MCQFGTEGALKAVICMVVTHTQPLPPPLINGHGTLDRASAGHPSCFRLSLSVHSASSGVHEAPALASAQLE